VQVVCLEANLGFGAANNVGMRRSTAEWVLLLNSDTVVPAGAIDTLFGRLALSRAVAAGPRLIDGQGRPEVSFGSMLSPLAEAVQKIRVRLSQRRGGISRWYVNRRLAHERSVDWVSGACLLMNRDKALAAGGFDERYFMYEEDVDLCAALRARGGSILFTPFAQVVHLRGQAIRKMPASSAPSQYDQSHVAFYEKHLPGWAPWLRRWLRWRGRSVG
jgi:GT2 family glycosyltransferase